MVILKERLFLFRATLSLSYFQRQRPFAVPEMYFTRESKSLLSIIRGKSGCLEQSFHKASQLGYFNLLKRLLIWTRMTATVIGRWVTGYTLGETSPVTEGQETGLKKKKKDRKIETCFYFASGLVAVSLEVFILAPFMSGLLAFPLEFLFVPWFSSHYQYFLYELVFN